MNDEGYGPVEYAARIAVAAICGYEVVALTTNLVPTVSQIVRRRPILEPLLIGGLIWHFRPTARDDAA